MRELDKIKSNFISVVAHQLRTPLSGIKWTLNMIISGELGPINNEQKTFLLKSYESNDRMINLVNDMLGADRVQSGKVHYNFRYIDILDLLDNVLFEMSSQAHKKNVSVEFNEKIAFLPKVCVDPDTMRAVFQNLLENSIKYTIDGGKIIIGAKTEGKNVLIEISDNGIGIPKVEQNNVFNRFFRATNAVKKETDGSGLGLFIAKSVVEKHGGKIWFESEEGQGTKFFFTIPIT